MVYFDSAEIYLESKSKLRDKIRAISAIIDALLLASVKAAGNEDLTEYTLNDGQTTIRAMYRGSESVMKSVQAYEKLKEYYINKLNGRSFRAIDRKSFPGYGGR